MISTPLKHVVVPAGHTHAPPFTHTQQPAGNTSTRRTPHHPHAHHAPPPPPHTSLHPQHAQMHPAAHELNLNDWLNITPPQGLQVPMMHSPYSHTPSTNLGAASPYAVDANGFMSIYNVGVGSAGAPDFLTSSPLPYSSPFVPVAAYPPHPYPPAQHVNVNYQQHPGPHMAMHVYPSPYGPHPHHAYQQQLHHQQQQQQQQHVQQQQQQHHQQQQFASPATSVDSHDASLLLSFAEYFSQTSSAGASPSPLNTSQPYKIADSQSPVERHDREADGESTPVTTLSAEDEDADGDTEVDAALRTPTGDNVTVAVHAPEENNSSQRQRECPLIELLRAASPGSAASVAPSPMQSPLSAVLEKARKPVESSESPFRFGDAPVPTPAPTLVKTPAPPASSATATATSTPIAAPQPRLPPHSAHTPFDSSPLSSLALSASDLASPSTRAANGTAGAGTSRQASRQSTPSVSRPQSRPSSALSSISRPLKVTRKVPPRRFPASPLVLQLPFSSSTPLRADGTQSPAPGQEKGQEKEKGLTPSFADAALAELQRGPLELSEKSGAGHTYRTRSKLKSLKAEIAERERAEDLAKIRRGVKTIQRRALGGAGEGGESEELSDVEMEDGAAQSRLDVLATISASKRIGAVRGARLAPPPARSPAPKMSSATATGRVTRGTKRTLKDVSDSASVRSASVDAGRRSPAKRARTERRSLATDREVDAQAALSAKVRSRTARSVKEATSASAPVGSGTRNRRAHVRKEPVRVEDNDEDDVESDEDTSSDFSVSGVGSGTSTPARGARAKSTRSSRGAKESAAKGKQRETPVRAKSGTSTPDATATVGAGRPTQEAPAERGPPVHYPSRSFPSFVERNADFPLLYRRFPVCAYLDPANPRFPPPPPGAGANPGGHYNTPRTALDLYTPRFVRGIGRDKAGLCPICYESRARGGAGRAEWLSMKFSAFNYHMQYAHGISPTTTLPFSPPVAFRTVARKQNHKNEKAEIREGKCHRCHEWAPVEGVKCVEAKLKEIYWWKHAAGCHKGSMLEGEDNAHVMDDVAQRVVAAYAASQPQGSTMSKSRSIMDTPQAVRINC